MIEFGVEIGTGDIPTDLGNINLAQLINRSFVGLIRLLLGGFG